MKLKHLLIFLIFISINAAAQLTPDVTSWIVNPGGATGYAGIPSNVQLVQYSSNWVYVSCTCIPGYDIGPWAGNPNIPSNQNFVFKITRAPQQNTGTPIATPNGHIGTWSNGVSIFNAKDARSYNNMNIWNQNAIVVEGASFDSCLGHPAPNGEYHHHLNPQCLYDETDSLNHSPIIGYAFDGFPIYGAYGYANPNGTGGIKRMKSSYRIRSIADRTTLPDGTVLTAGQYGPAISATYPLGYYLEDFEYINGLGDLDAHNGRVCVSPDYPSGIYSYFVTIDSTLKGAFPYTLGPTYYGTVPSGNTGPGSGHNTISEPVTIYNPTSSVNELENDISFTMFPNPAISTLYISVNVVSIGNMNAYLLNNLGEVIYKLDYMQPTITYSIDLSSYPNGVYFLRLEKEDKTELKKVIIAK